MLNYTVRTANQTADGGYYAMDTLGCLMLHGDGEMKCEF